MVNQYFKQAIASLRENPLVGFLTILGTALSVAMFMVLILVCQVKTTSFSPVSERHRMLYITWIQSFNEHNSGYRAQTYGYRIVKDCFYNLKTPEAVAAATRDTEKRRVSVSGVKLVKECDIRQVDATYWKVFDFRFVSGAPFNEETFASAMPVAVLSDRIAREYFGTTDVVGETIQLDFIDYKVHGVVRSVSEAVPEAYGEIWIPFSVNKAIMSTNSSANGVGGNLQVYILARSSADFEAIRQETKSLVSTFNTGQEYQTEIWKQPITSLQQMFYYVPLDRMHGNFSGMLSLAALFLLLPVFNLLAIISSQMKKRQPEIGIRKAFGATTKDIIGQVLSENFIITLIGGIIGLILSVLFFYIAKDSLLERNDVQLQFGMLVQPLFFISTLLVCLFINILSSGVPAWRAARAEVINSLHSNV